MDDLKALYQDIIVDHGKRPRNKRRPAGTNRTARGYNPLCGDQVTVFLEVAEDGAIAEAGFDGKGCVLCLASASMMTEQLAGLNEHELSDLAQQVRRICTEGPTEEDKSDAAMEQVIALSGVRDFPSRVKCVTLPWHATLAAMAGEEETTTE